MKPSKEETFEPVKADTTQWWLTQEENIDGKNKMR
jgi:hypothetical protein